MSRIEITDEMVSRGLAAYGKAYDAPQNDPSMRAALEAALNSEAEDIPVSEAMLSDGLSAWHGTPQGKTQGEALTNVYRAMERVRRCEAVQDAIKFGRHEHQRTSDNQVTYTVRHRRKDDPK